MNAILTPIGGKQVQKEVIEKLTALVLSGQIPYGSRLPTEAKLAATMKVSRATLREALKLFALLGITKSRRGSGTYLTATPAKTALLNDPLTFRINEKDFSLMELTEARLLFEPHAAFLAAKRATSAQIRNMALEVKGMFDNFDDLDSYLLHDVRFHDQVIQATGNRFLIHIDYSLNNYLLQSRLRTSKNVARSTLERNAEAHQVILGAIRKRDAELAEKLMYEHLQKAADIIRSLERSPGGQSE